MRLGDEGHYFSLNPQKIQVVEVENNVTPISYNEDESNPFNLQANITNRSEFLICNGDETHEHVVTNEEVLTNASPEMEVEIANSMNAYTDSNGDTEYDGACHSAAITGPENSHHM